MPAIATPAENRLLLLNISWETYERLLGESIDNCGTRFTYDDGSLEIMVVSIGHEMAKSTLELLVRITAEETGRSARGAGSTTFRRKDLAKGGSSRTPVSISSMQPVSAVWTTWTSLWTHHRNS